MVSCSQKATCLCRRYLRYAILRGQRLPVLLELGQYGVAKLLDGRRVIIQQFLAFLIHRFL